MKKTVFFIGLFLTFAVGTYAQKFALIDMEYLLKNIPSYEKANEQLEQISKRWQSEVEKKQSEVQAMYKSYQADLVFLAGNEKTKRENAIVAKEKELQDLRSKYFGAEGDLFKRRQALIKPIQDEVYNAVKELSSRHGYQLVLDRASATSVIFASPNIDISDEVLRMLGYSR